jgi:hypothetical protein
MPYRLVYAQLQTADASHAKEFYAQLCGWTLIDDPVGPGPPYTEALINGERIAGIMSVETAGLSRWVPYFSVEDLDSGTEKAKRLGATIVFPPTDLPSKGCRVSVLTDPNGVPFGLRGPLP